MMKWLGRTLILLVAVVVVSGIAYGIVQSSGDTGGQPPFEGRGAQVGGQGEGTGQPPERGDVRGGTRGGREGFNFYAIDQLLRPLIIIAAIVVVVAPIAALFRKRGSPRRTVPVPDS
jgi:hypothetical protein